MPTQFKPKVGEMTWYAAHIVIGMLTEEPKRKISAYENVILLQAASFIDAENMARLIGIEDASIDDGLTVDGAPARRVFAGVRKVVTISNYEGDQDRDPPGHRTEISYSEFKLKSMDHLNKFGSGDEVELIYI